MLEELLKKHTELQNKTDVILYNYLYNKRGIDFPLTEDEERKTCKTNIKKFNREYLKIREELLDIYDEINNLDEDTFNSIVEPVPEDIDYACTLIDEYKLKKHLEGLVK